MYYQMQEMQSQQAQMLLQQLQPFMQTELWNAYYAQDANVQFMNQLLRGW